MPLMLNNLAASTVVKTYSPTFFSSVLTGNGKGEGLLCELRDPRHKPDDRNISVTQDAYDPVYTSFKNGDTQVKLIPFFLQSKKFLTDATRVMPIDVSNLTKIATSADGRIKVYVRAEMHSCTHTHKAGKLNQTTGYRTPPQTTFVDVWRLDVISINANADPNDPFKVISKNNYTSTGNAVNPMFTANIRYRLTLIEFYLEQHGYAVDRKAMDVFCDNLSLHGAITTRSKAWQTTIDKEFELFCQNLKLQPFINEVIMSDLIDVLHRLEAYTVPLELYRHIYQTLIQYFGPSVVKELCKDNLNLLLSDTLQSLNDMKDSLIHLSIPDPKPTIDPMFSREQVDAITTDSPLVLVAAGAGAGKSASILGRIKFLCDCEVQPSDITVLSFTNAAADHIKELNPAVNSMTIARMIHSIYELNYSGHTLSTPETLMNSIDIYCPNDAFAYSFKDMLQQLKDSASTAFTKMNLFVERNFDEVMRVLDICHQTTLELEIIICYQKIDSLAEPPGITSKYLIIDEVQDNSIFEFIYVLKYTGKHKQSLYIVGDASQTLFEFRASNPRAINVMEGSGVLDTYKLQTNYRSNQEILDFANVALQQIEANQYANIQLRANSLKPVTLQSFQDAVSLSYHFVRNKAELEVILPQIFNLKLKNWLDSRVAKGEQITFLAYKGRQVQQMINIVKQMYPSKSCVSIVPDKVYATTLFSSFICKFWDEIQFMPSSSAIVTIQTEITSHLDALMRSKKQQKLVPGLLVDWADSIRPLTKSWLSQLNAGVITYQKYINNIKEQMLEYEIQRNAIQQTIASNRNNERKHNHDVQNADFLFSTIHSAKGLEFDHVVVLYEGQTRMSEANKRMYYVALTRAMKSEYVIAYGTTKTAPVEVDYNTIIAKLTTAGLPANNVDKDDGVIVDTED